MAASPRSAPPADDASAIDAPTCSATKPHNALPRPSPPWNTKRQMPSARARTHDEKPASNEHGDERRSVARVADAGQRRADHSLGGKQGTRRLTAPAIHDDKHCDE